MKLNDNYKEVHILSLEEIQSGVNNILKVIDKTQNDSQAIWQSINGLNGDFIGNVYDTTLSTLETSIANLSNIGFELTELLQSVEVYKEEVEKFDRGF